MKKIKYSFILFCILVLGFWIQHACAQEAQLAEATKQAQESQQAQKEAYPFIETTKKISLDLKDASLKDVLKSLSIQSGINFIASQEIEDRMVTLYLDNVSVKEAADKILKANKLDYEYDEKANIILVKKEEPRIETITKVFPLKYAMLSTSPIQREIIKNLREEAKEKGTRAEEERETRTEEERTISEEEEVKARESGISAVISRLLSPMGSLVEDPRTNSLVVTDFPSRLKIIEEAIKKLDVPVPQVMLEVEMLDVSKEVLDNLGFDLGLHPFTIILPGEFAHKGARLFIGSLKRREDRRIENPDVEGWTILGTSYAALLDFLRTRTDTKCLARPRILTLNNETAEIRIETNELIGVEPKYEVAEGGGGGQVITGYEQTRERTGVSLRVTPQVNLETGEITMFILPKVAEASLSRVQPEKLMEGQTPYQDVEERFTKSVVKISDGETIIAGGLIHTSELETLKKVPFLGDIPILGMLFSHKEKTEGLERELLVFITPHIIKDTGVWPAPSINAILSSREQDIPSKESRLSSIKESRLSSIKKALDSFDRK